MDVLEATASAIDIVVARSARDSERSRVDRLILNTRWLFCRLLRAFNIATVFDIGSLDGSEAMRFRRMVPNANILALEPNPRNFSKMATDERLRRASIRILPYAAADSVSCAPFHIFSADYEARNDPRRGVGSLYSRLGSFGLVEVVNVPTVRIDELVRAESLKSDSVALWIDAEGVAFEVISGCADILDSCRLVHVEVESEPIINREQKLAVDIDRILRSSGFTLIATDQKPGSLQYNALYIQTRALRENWIKVVRQARVARIHRNVSTLLRWLLPARVKRLLRFYDTETRCR